MGRSPHRQFRLTVRWYNVLCLLFLPSPPAATAQPQPPTSAPLQIISVSLATDRGDSTYSLPHQFVVAGSDTLTTAAGRHLLRGDAYVINYRYGTVRFLRSVIDSLLADTTQKAREISVRYRYLPFHFRESYFKRQFTVLKDSTGRDTMRVATQRTSFTADDIFGPNIQKSGSLVRGFTVGSNRDLSLNSGLRLQLSGKLSSDIDIAAALTDESTPIQPEGTTQTLQEFDKVFVEMRGSDFAATLGDFNLDFTGSEFARLSRKLQGAKGTADYRLGSSRGSVTISGAVPRGKFATNQFQGAEGVQGPYRLTGRNNERAIIVIAGTEKVYVNGELKTRGETNDYTIDYATGEVTFTARHLITAASRIVIDFEYTDRQFARSFLGGQTSSEVFDGKAKFNVSFFREADDPDSPIDFAFSDSARAVIANAGADRDKAVLSGVALVDSNGLYVAVDTLLSGGITNRFYRYAPGPDAHYVVNFSYVGSGNGEYIRQQSLVYVWRGQGNGDYMPIRYLPIPQAENIFDVGLDVSPTSDLKITGEFGRSAFDANRLSSLDDVNNAGSAYKLAAAFTPRNVRIGGLDVGSIELQVKQRFVDSRFVPIDRTNDIEFNRKWGIEATTLANEELQEASLKITPRPSLSIGGGYGKITRGDQFRSVRNDASLVMKGESLPTVDYYLESVRSKETLTDNSSSWLRQKGFAEYSLWNFTPGIRFEAENRKINSIQTLSSKPGSFRFDVFAPGLKIANLGSLSLSGELEWRSDDLFNNGGLVRESNSFTQAYAARLSEWNRLNSSLDITLRKKTFSPEFKQFGNADVKTILVRSQSRYSPLNRGVEADLFYEVTTERSSKQERVFVRVAQGAGNYRYLGDLNHNGIAEESEFELTRFDGDFISLTLPTDKLYPIIDLKTSLRFRINPRQFIQQPSGFLESAASIMSTETYIRVDEKSTESNLKDIYLLNFKKFLQDSTTISGSNLFTQDLYFLEGRPEFSTRLRFSQRKGLNQLSGGNERSYVRERSIRLRWQLVREISNQIDIINKVDRVSGSQGSSRVRDITSNSVVFDLSYRPEQDIEVGFKLETGKSTDNNQTPALNADINTQALRFVYALQGAGQARVEATREEVGLGRALDSFPFELTGGRVAGKTWLWRCALDYRVTQFIQATVNYDGRSEGGRTPVHTARAEVRAFF